MYTMRKRSWKKCVEQVAIIFGQAKHVFITVWKKANILIIMSDGPYQVLPPQVKGIAQ